MLKTPHHGIEPLGVSRALRILPQPLPEYLVERPTLRAGNGMRPLDQVLVGAEGDVLHTKTVYTGFVRMTGSDLHL